MKRYNLSEIMKRAHNFYKTSKYTWSESLKKSWKMAKFSVRVKEDIANIVDYKAADNKSFADRLREEAKGYKPAGRSSYDDLSIPASAYYNPYSYGLFGSHYVGD